MNTEFHNRMVDVIRDLLEDAGSLSDADVLKRVEEAVLGQKESNYMTSSEKKAAVDRLFHTFRGLDLLQPLLEDDSISEIMINGYKDIFIEREGRMERYPLSFENQEKLEDIIQIMVAKVNRIVNESSPVVDARLADGSRVHVVLPPLALNGPTVTIRKFPDQPLTLEQLVTTGSLTEEARQLLVKLVKAKYNIFIGGGTGSGKTTFLNALSGYIPVDERVITIEDSAELQLHGIANLVSLETRNSNTEGKGKVTISDLIRASLRMRPNRIIVGEVRGSEALDMLQAMNTGHDGSLSTGHANSVTDMISRLETMVLSAAPLPIPVIRSQICSAVDIMVHLSRLRDRSRRVTEISEVAGMNNGEVMLNPLYRFEENLDEQGGRMDNTLQVNGRLVSSGNRLLRTQKWLNAGLKEDAM
ncbi:CpaF family protein [Paenibacillus gansuensis]|uniref:CpaF family protein n=1 Tax=Paenibacillus gansuensis TaxID=306542 RepID=A0ABW5PA41_9BACL